jgi:capsular polysaccharide biosynthesis protein
MPGSRSLRRACGRTATAADWVTATGTGRVHSLHAPASVHRPRWSSAVSGSPQQVESFVAPAAQVVELPGGAVWGLDGTVVTIDGCVAENTTRAWGRALEDHPIWRVPPTTSHHIHGVAAVIAARGAAINFAHFLADALPSIQLIRDAHIDIDAWIVSGDHHVWQRDGLALAGIPAHDVITLTAHNWVSADVLIVPSRTGFAPATAPWARNALTRLINSSSRRRHRRIFISRNQSRRRRLINANEVAVLLAPHGFEHVHFDDTPLLRQLQIIHETQMIVGVHGAALAHLLHAPPDGTVIEIANPAYAHPEFWGLASLSGWDHVPIDAASVRPHGLSKNTDELNWDLHVDPETVLAAIMRFE